MSTFGATRRSRADEDVRPTFVNSSVVKN